MHVKPLRILLLPINYQKLYFPLQGILGTCDGVLPLSCYRDTCRGTKVPLLTQSFLGLTDTRG